MEEENLYTFPRAIIITSLKEKPNQTIESLVLETKLSRGAIKHQLGILQKRGLITISERKEGEKGKPVSINITNKATPLKKKTIERLEALAKFFRK